MPWTHLVFYVMEKLVPRFLSDMNKFGLEMSWTNSFRGRLNVMYNIVSRFMSWKSLARGSESWASKTVLPATTRVERRILPYQVRGPLQNDLSKGTCPLKVCSSCETEPIQNTDRHCTSQAFSKPPDHFFSLSLSSPRP